jgi:hypothetical protein
VPRGRVSTRSPVRTTERTDGRWVALLPNWVSALAALVSAAAAIIGLVVISHQPGEIGQPEPSASIASLTEDASGIDARGAYEGLAPRDHDVVLMLRPDSADVSGWLVVVANRSPSVDDAEPEDGTWSASAPVDGNLNWLATVAIIPATPEGAALNDLLRQLRAKGPAAPSVIEAAEVRSVG